MNTLRLDIINLHAPYRVKQSNVMLITTCSLAMPIAQKYENVQKWQKKWQECIKIQNKFLILHRQTVVICHIQKNL